MPITLRIVGVTSTTLASTSLTPLAIPTNLIAGSGGYVYWRFLLYDAAGEITWLVVYGGLGYLFGSNWEALSQLLSDLSGLLAGVVLLAIGSYFLWRYRRRAKSLLSAPESEPSD